ncbi:MAG: helix-turn-helix domain-containing protein [Chryseotalea sp.]
MKKALLHCKPTIQFTETFINISENKQVIKYAIPESNVKPHSIKTNNGWRTFIRVNDQCLQASKELTEVLKRSKKKSGFQFTFGDQEKLLMQYLEVHQFITLIECANLLKINKWRASRKLILLVLADVLKIEPSEKGDRYVRVFQ